MRLIWRDTGPDEERLVGIHGHCSFGKVVEDRASGKFIAMVALHDGGLSGVPTLHAARDEAQDHVERGVRDALVSCGAVSETIGFSLDGEAYYQAASIVPVED